MTDIEYKEHYRHLWAKHQSRAIAATFFLFALGIFLADRIRELSNG